MNLDTKRESRPETISRALDHAGRRLRLNALALGISWWLAVSLGLWLLICLLDHFLRLPQGLRLSAAITGAAVFSLGFLRKIWRPAGRRPPRERVALILENRFGIAYNALINSYQFEQHQDLQKDEKAFADRLIDLSRNMMSRQKFSELLEWRRMAKWGGYMLTTALLWILCACLLPTQMLNACLRCALPLADIPPAGSIGLKVVPAHDLVLREGDSLQVRAMLSKQGAWTPIIIWREGAPAIDPEETGSDVMKRQMAVESGAYCFTFNEVKRSFAFRVLVYDTYSRSIHVEVAPAPRIEGATFTITPPAYTGLKNILLPGPPALLSALPESQVTVALDIRPAVENLTWKGYNQEVKFAQSGRQYRAVLKVVSAGPYTVEATDRWTQKPYALARGQISLQIDNPPSIDFLTTDRNRFVSPGADVKLDLEATDDYGISKIAVTVREAEQTTAGRTVKQWHYLGPPGTRGPLKETLILRLDPQTFQPGSVHVLEAWCADFCPQENAAQSGQVVLRVKSLNDITARPDDPLAQAIVSLREAIEVQKKANSITENLEVNLPEVITKLSLSAHKSAITEPQEKSRSVASRAALEFSRISEGKSYANRLDPLVQGEMPWVLKDIGALKPAPEDVLRQQLALIRKRQVYILTELISLLGITADRAMIHAPPATAEKADDGPPPVSPKETGKELMDDLQKFISEQKRIIDKTKSLLDGGLEDLTKEEETILGALAREEARWATFFEEKLTDFSKLPLQDFSDGSIAEEFNKVFMEIKKAAKSLYDRKLELAVPQEQSGLENAEKLENNLERWLMDVPDVVKWNMEEPPFPADVAIAELPSELEDIVGRLIDKEEAMTDEVEDVTSSWLDSIDKGAGWDAADGPISSMSAKGVTGNLLPNQQEVGGRAGEGRTGRSSGQMVADKAEGKGGRETPTRMTPNPFEQGNIQDSSKDDSGGATGGGKLSGFTGEGLRGPAASPRLRQKMARLANRQVQIRQEAEPLALKLRAYHLPSGDIETAMENMKRFEREAKDGSGPGIRRSFSRIIDALQDAKQNVHAQSGLRREGINLPQVVKDEIMKGLQDGIPAGYEQMVEAYFKALAERKK